jgi:hypothetical protein
LKGLKKGKGNALKKFFKKTLPSGLIHQGLPILGSVSGTALGSISGPIGSLVGSQVGEKSGQLLADEVGKKTGLGLTRRLKQIGR